VLVACELAVDTGGLTGGGDAGREGSGSDVNPPEDRNAQEASNDAATFDGGPDFGVPDASGMDVIADTSADAPKRPSLVLQQPGSTANAASLVITLAAAPRDGDALVVAVAATDNTPSSVTGGGVTWALLQRSGLHVPASVWAGFAASAGGSTVTITWATSQRAATALLTEWSGLVTSVNYAVNNGTALVISTAPLPVTAGQLVFAAAGMHYLMAGTPSNGYVPLDTVGLPGNDDQLLAAYLYATGVGQTATDWTQTAPSGWDSVVVAFGP
jgi:hypothetical protein